MDLLHVLLLGAIQGVTEFFPVSSSGHLILTPVLFGWEDQGLAFDTILHLGTLVAVLWAFRGDLADVGTRALVKKEPAARRLTLQVIVAAIPALAVGALVEPLVEGVLRGPILVAADLAFWGVVLFFADRYAASHAHAMSKTTQITWTQTLVIGCSQVFALLPGTSRSGITMTGGLFAGLDRKTTVDFSFLVSIPTIAAAGGYGILKMIRSGMPSDGMLPLALGFLAAAVTGAWAIRFLRSYVSKNTFTPFVWYRLALAALVLVLVR